MRRTVSLKNACATFVRSREGCEFHLQWRRKQALHAALFEAEDGDVLLACLERFGGLKMGLPASETEPAGGEKRRPLPPPQDRLAA